MRRSLCSPFKYAGSLGKHNSLQTPSLVLHCLLQRNFKFWISTQPFLVYLRRPNPRYVSFTMQWMMTISSILEDVKNGTIISTYSQVLKGSLDILSISDNLELLDSRRIVLPIPAVKPILKLLHSSHSGVTKTTNLAHGLYFWPGMTNDMKQLVSMCQDCIRILPSQPANPKVTPPPSSHFGFPMQHVGWDLFSYAGKVYLICVDHWSGYPFYHLLHSLTSDSILKILTSWFNPFGWPSSN